MSIIRDGNQEWVRIPLPGAEGVSILEGVTQAEADQLDIMSLVEIIPVAA
jgi:hypothetical protein